MQLILLTLQKLPLKVDHLKQVMKHTSSMPYKKLPHLIFTYFFCLPIEQYS